MGPESAYRTTAVRRGLLDATDAVLGVLTDHGVDVAALASRNGMDGDDIAGEWRDW